MNTEKRTLLNATEMDRTLARMAHEIVEKHKGTKNLCLVGIRTGGVPLAFRLQKKIHEIEDTAPDIGVLDITLYRDDWSTLSQHPIVRSTDIPFSVNGKNIILVDDVIYTGRTIRAALDALTDYGRPGKIELAVLVDRGRRELPIQPDYAGLTLSTSKDEHVNVYLREVSGRDEVLLEKTDGN